MTYCGEGDAPAARAPQGPVLISMYLQRMNVTACTTITTSHAGKWLAAVLVRLRSCFGTTHCRSSACSGRSSPLTYRGLSPANCTGPTQSLNLAQPVAQGTLGF